MKLCHHGDEGDHEGLRSGGRMETCEMFLRKTYMHHGNCHGDKLAGTMVLSGNLLCVYFNRHRKTRSQRIRVEEFKEDYML